MEKQRQTKVLSILALVAGVLGLTLGFAAFSNTLIISSSANVKPDSSSFSVVFSSSGSTLAQAAITAVGNPSTVTGADATISGTKITGLKANFTEPGQTITYSFYAHNAGSYLAYLRSVDFGTAQTCVKTASTTTDSLVTAACDDISVKVSVNGTEYTANNDTISGHSLATTGFEPVVVTITYAANGDRADGEFNVTFGDITLEYSSVDYTAA